MNNVHIAALMLNDIYKRNVHFDYKWNKYPGLHSYFYELQYQMKFKQSILILKFVDKLNNWNTL